MRFLSAMLLCLGAAGLTPCLADPPDSAPAAASQPATPAAKAASTPAVAATQTAPATSQPAAPATAKTASTAASATPTKTADTLDADEHHLMDLGYQPEMHNGTKLWCKREEELGSRLGSRRKVCGTVEELTVMERQAQDQFRQQQAASFQPGSQQGNVGR